MSLNTDNTAEPHIQPKDIAAMLKDRNGVCRWLVFNLTPNIAGAMTTYPERRFITTASGPQHCGTDYLVRSIQADGYFLGKAPESEAEMKDMMAQAGIVEADILRGFMVAHIIENEKMRAEVFGADVR